MLRTGASRQIAGMERIRILIIIKARALATAG
jgi:hypothetical protein